MMQLFLKLKISRQIYSQNKQRLALRISAITNFAYRKQPSPA